MATFPEWWSWDLELSPHLLKRMVDRGFNETDLRVMLESVARIAPNTEAGRWVVTSRFEHRDWEIIVEPSHSEKLLVVITAYPSE